jgi:uncharacterized membrane protein YkoI
MTRSLPAILLAALVATGSPAAADAPQEDALPLSEILRMIEERDDVRYFKEVEWDDDGYWEVEFYRTDGSEAEVDIDPRTGDPRG